MRCIFAIPMMGRSSRFFGAGYDRPKYELPLRGESLFSHAVRSFQSYFEDATFAFMVRSDHDSEAFVRSELARLGIGDARITVLPGETAGQAETVFLGLRDVGEDDSLFIFNIDTIRPGYRIPALVERCDGYLEVFQGEGTHWSFVEPGPGQTVLRTTEKDRISDLCCDGLYFFRRKGDFDHAFLEAREADERQGGELYVAPLYNRLIQRGRTILYDPVPIEAIRFSGTPDEYRALLARG